MAIDPCLACDLRGFEFWVSDIISQKCRTLFSFDCYSPDPIMTPNSVWNTTKACRKNMIDIGADKTRLQVYAKKGFMVDKDVETPIFINEQNIPFTDLAEHIDVIRSTSGNGPALMA